MKKAFLILICILLTSIVYSQNLRWVNQSTVYIDLVDKKQNIYIGSSPYGTQDIDPGEKVLNINGNVEGTYFVKYDPSFNIEWYKTSSQPDYCFRNAIMSNNDMNELFLLYDKKKDLTNNSSRYYIAKYSSDGTLEFEKEAFYLELGDGPIRTDIFDINLDSSANVWISGMVAGKIAFGENGIVNNIPDGIAFMAKYDENGQLLKVIKRTTNKYFGRNYRGTNFKIDQAGTTHQIIYENNSYFYIATDTLENETRVKIIVAPDTKVAASHLILSDTCFFVVGTFSEVFDSDNSEKIKCLNPKGTKDIFVAKYDLSGKMLDSWQIGGNGSIDLSDNVKLKNNNLIITVISEGRSIIDYAMGPDMFNVELNNQMANVCYDLFQQVKDTVTSTVSDEDLVADIAPGPLSSNPKYLVNFKDTLYFAADDGKTGFELWKSDGTANGTVLVKDLNPDGDSFNPAMNNNDRYPIMANSQTLFVTPDTIPWGTLWTYNGDLSKITKMSSTLAYYKFIVKDKFYAQQIDGNYLVTDGSENEAITKTFNIDPSFLKFNYILNNDSVIYYYSYSNDPSFSSNIYSYDGELFKKLFSLNRPIQGLETYNGKLYFYELNGGIVPIKLSSVNEDGTNYAVVYSFPNNVVRMDEAKYVIKNLGDKLIFMGFDDINNLELWVTDGTPQNTHIIKDLNPSGSLKVNNFELNRKNVLFFSADDGHGMDLFQTDGTSQGTLKLRGLSPFGNVNYNSMAIVKDILFFGATNNNSGCELWKYKFIDKIEVQNKTLTYSTDSSQINVNIEVEVLPKDATDKSLTFSLVESSRYNADIDSFGGIILTPKYNLKSASLNDSLQIKIQANDGSKESTIYNLSLNSQPTNVNKLNNDFMVWPNPATEKLNIKSDNSFIETVLITDISGRLMFQKSYNKIKNASIDLTSFPKGLFLIKVQSNKVFSIKKFLHQ